MSTLDIIERLREMIAQENENMAESRDAGVNSPGFNQDMGARDALQRLLDEIEEGEE